MVEDDAVLALSIKAALGEAGAAEVVVCPSLASAMEALEQVALAAIVLDVHLADRHDGWALAELATLLGPTPPRIVFSTGSLEDIPAEVAELGPVFEKPYDPVQLAAVLVEGARRGLISRLLG